MTEKKNNYILQRKKGAGGFTLIELLVAMATFSVIVVAILEILLAGLSGAQRVFGKQNIQETGRFILESISKEIRMSEINTPDGGPYATLSIVNSKGQTIDYLFDSTSKRLIRGGQYLSSSKVETTGSFYVQRVAGKQARVTVVLGLKNISKDWK